MASSTPFVEHDPSISTYKQAIKFSKPPGDHHTPFSHDTIASKKDGLSADADVTLSSGVQRLDINTTTTDTTLPKRTFFSLPPEIRNMVYGYLIPIRVHIYQPDAQTISIKAFNPWRLASIAQKSPPKPWTLISVSRQFRAEIRSVVYPRTHIDIHLQWNYKMKDAYETWIEGLDEGVAGSIRHLRIDDWIEIDRMPDSSVADFEWGYGFFGLRGTDLRYCRQTRGNWEIAWLRYIEFDEFSRLGFMEKTICDMEDHLEIPIAMVGLGKKNIRKLVNAHCRCRRNLDPPTDTLSLQNMKLWEEYIGISRMPSYWHV